MAVHAVADGRAELRAREAPLARGRPARQRPPHPDGLVPLRLPPAVAPPLAVAAHAAGAQPDTINYLQM